MRIFRLHKVATGAILLLGLAGSGGAIAAEKNAATEIRDLYYGEVLYQFYQQKDFEALTHLLAAQQAGRVTHHADEAELLLGGLYLAYGQHRQAADIFSRLLDESTDPLVRDRAWLYIGKARYERGQFELADDAFARVGGALPEWLDEELRMLRAQSLMAQGQFSQASALLDEWEGTESWQAYANYNLGIAFVRMQQIDEGAKRLEAVGGLKSDDAELVALRDKANLALGYAYLQAEEPEKAKWALQRVRLNGPFSNKALLGVGWADALVEDYRAALIPWLELRDRDMLDSAVQESLLAVPYAFSRLGADGSAAEYYTAAMEHFDGELSSLGGAIGRARAGQLVPALLAGDDEEIGHWNWSLEQLPDTNDARYLYHLIANHEFQEGLRSYRDLVALREHLSGWLQKIATYEDMIATRRLAYEQRLPEVEARFADTNVAELTVRRDDLAARLARVESDRDIVGLADENEDRLWQDIAALKANPAFETDKGVSARNKYRILNGTLLWQLDADYQYRLWQQKRGLEKLDEQLVLAGDNEARVMAAREQMPLRLDEYENRIALLTPRVDAMLAEIMAALDEQENHLTLVVTDELEAQKSRLVSYRQQARFALATIYDQATLAEGYDGDSQ